MVTISGPVEGLPPDTYRKEIRDEVISTHIELPMRRFIAPLADLSYSYRLYKTLRAQKCTAIITFTTKPNIYGQLAAFFARVPFRVVAVRGLGRTFMRAETLQELAIQQLVKVLYRLSCALAHKVWFTNNSALFEMVSSGLCTTGKTYLSKNAVDLEDFSAARIDPRRIDALRTELDLQKEDVITVMVARLLEEKGVREFANAAILLKEQLPRLHFLLVAPKESASPSVPLDFLRRSEACSNLRWLGFRKDVRELYALSDLAVLPSYYKEGGYPRALLEAMAYAKPVVAADTPECRGPVEDGVNGFLVPPRDATALAIAIRKIIENPSLKESMGQASLRKMRSEFDDKVIFGTFLRDVLLLN